MYGRPYLLGRASCVMALAPLKAPHPPPKRAKRHLGNVALSKRHTGIMAKRSAVTSR